jgi:hypothetical protein
LRRYASGCRCRSGASNPRWRRARGSRVRDYSIADIDAYALVDPLRDLAPELVNDERSPRLVDWLGRIAARPAVRAARARSRSGHPEQAFVPGVEAARWG